MRRIVSGGQTGVDRAALDAAIEAGLAVGGWVPRGRRAEDGPIAATYPMREAPSPAYEERTRLNVRDSDATLILAVGRPTGGTALTAAFARALSKPHLVVDLDDGADARAARDWLDEHRVRTLNVAGPRESTAPGVYERALAYLRGLLDAPPPTPERRA